MNQVKTKLKHIDKLHEIFIIVLSISFSFTILFFSPAELLLRNQKDFLLDTGHILFPMLILSLGISVISIVLLNILLMICETAYIVMSRIMAGLLFAFYIQEMFLNSKMKAITGDALRTDFPLLENILNFLLNYLLLMLPLLLHFKKKPISFSGKKYILPYLTGLIFLMQIFGLLGTVSQFGFKQYERLFNIYPSYQSSMSLSKERNIVVFLFDRLDSFYMDEILETYPELYQELDGFTFYQDNLSHYSSTFPSVSYMFTGMPYDGSEEWVDYFEKAWADENFLDELKQHDYHINLFLDSLTTYGRYTQLANRCDNLESLHENEYRFNYLRKNGIVPMMIRLSLGKGLPYCLKEQFIGKIKSDFSSDFIRLEQEIPSRMDGAVGNASDLKYYTYLTSAGLTDNNPQNTFTFLHLAGAHDESEEVAHLYSGELKTGSFETLATARGEFEIILEYIRQMKELDLYDQSTIIILGDHGYASSQSWALRTKKSVIPVITGLLIKPAHAQADELKTDNSAELSNDYFAASILDYAGIDHEQYGYSYSDIIEQNIHQERIFQMVRFHLIGDIDFGELQKVNGNSRDFNNWELIE